MYGNTNTEMALPAHHSDPIPPSTQVVSKVDIPTGMPFSMANPPAYDLGKLRQRHFDILHLHMFGVKEDGTRLSQKDIAAEVGVTEPMVSYTLNSTIAKSYMSSIREDFKADAVQIQRKIQEVAPVALQVATDVMMSPTTKAETRLKAAQDFLDRAGHKPVNINLTAHATTDEIEMAKKLARESEFFQEAVIVEEDDPDISYVSNGSIE